MIRPRYVVRRSDECGSLVRDGVVVDHTWDVVDRVTGWVVANHGTRKAAREDAHDQNVQALQRKMLGIE